jgi:periplasmic protein TonB
MAAVMTYRIFDLPWSPIEGEERRFRRILGAILLLFIAVGSVIPFLPVPERPATAPELPERVVQMVLEKPKPPPKPVIEPKEVPKPKVEETVRPVPKPKPVVPTLDARQRAEKAGVFQIKDELADLREIVDTAAFASTQNLTGKTDGPSHAERSLITAGVATGSRGINTAALSRGYGTGVGSLRGHATTQNLPLAAESQSGQQAKRSGSGKRAARTQEEVELVFDRNKSALYAIYSRALRERPELRGKFVVQLTIAPSGEVTACQVVSSELNDADLERKLVARIRMFRFEQKDVEVLVATKPIEFFPA